MCMCTVYIYSIEGDYMSRQMYLKFHYEICNNSSVKIQLFMKIAFGELPCNFQLEAINLNHNFYLNQCMRKYQNKILNQKHALMNKTHHSSLVISVSQQKLWKEVLCFL